LSSPSPDKTTTPKIKRRIRDIAKTAGAAIEPAAERPAPEPTIETAPPIVEAPAPVADPIEVPSPPRFHADTAAALDEIENQTRKLVDIADRNTGALLSEGALLIGLDRLRDWLAERARKPH
jgi:hypothetical protein